jgi:dihydrofolate synthase / folylpolyglutamate synthase
VDCGLAVRNRYRLTVMGEDIDVDSPLAGRHQLRNIALAISTAEELARFGFTVTPGHIEQGIRETYWPGRFQVVPPSVATHQHLMVLDAAHNPAGAWALRSALSESLSGRELTFVFAAMRDKPLQEIAEILFPVAEQVMLTQVANPRAATTSELLQAASRTGVPLYAEETLPAALERAHALSKPEGVVVVTGSIFLIGEAMTMMGLKA